MLRAAIDAHLMRLARSGAGGDGEPRDGTDGRQRLAAKAERGDVREIVFTVGARQLRGRMAFDGKAQIGSRHALAIVFDKDEVGAAIGNGDDNAPRARIERVFDQFLGRTRGTLDHLARRDAVDRAFGKTADFG